LFGSYTVKRTGLLPAEQDTSVSIIMTAGIMILTCLESTHILVKNTALISIKTFRKNTVKTHVLLRVVQADVMETFRLLFDTKPVILDPDVVTPGV